MSTSADFLLSVVVPVYNEAAGLTAFHHSLLNALQDTPKHEIIYVDDGSGDETTQLVRDFCHDNPKVRLVCLSRNFGKENALTAGIAQAKGDAILTIDGDGQHPVELIPEFIAAWQSGSQVVVGVRKKTDYGSAWRRLQSKVFYRVFNRLSDQKLVPGSTDFRLIDRQVQQAFLSMTENDRMTRGLIDWLGFKRHLIYFMPKQRAHGQAAYSQRKLMVLGVNSFVSLTSTPLYLFGYLGLAITSVSFVAGTVIFIEQLLLDDPLHWKFTGTAMLGILIIFLVGIVLLSQGILSLYISLLHNQSKQRPLFVIDQEASVGIKKDGHGAK